jgi:hypothetical protein
VRDDGSIGQLERRQLLCAGGPAEFVARSSAQERPRTAVARDHLLIADASGTERFLNSPTWMHARPTVIAVADKQPRYLF